MPRNYRIPSAVNIYSRDSRAKFLAPQIRKFRNHRLYAGAFLVRAYALGKLVMKKPRVFAQRFFLARFPLDRWQSFSFLSSFGSKIFWTFS